MSSSDTYPETALVQLLKKKDERAFSYLYDHYAAALYGVIIRMVNVEETANDVLQEAFVKIWHNIKSYDPQKGKLFTWMLHIARNTAIDTLRSRSFRQDQEIRALRDDVDIKEEERSVSLKTDHIGLQHVLEQLSEDQRLMIDLAYFKGFTREEISKELDIPLGTVKTRIRTALMRLRDILK